MLILLRALTQHAVISVAEVEKLANDAGLIVYVAAFASAFGVGILLIAISLFRARTVRRWIPLSMASHAITLPFISAVPEALRPVHTLLIGVALIGAAVSANESWSSVYRRPSL